MKTNKTETATYTFNFSPVEKLMLTAQAAEVKLSDALSTIWNATPIEFRVVSKFREQFTAFAKARGYGDTWIRRTLAENDELRLRKTSKTMSATKKAKAAANRKPKTMTATALFNEAKASLAAKTISHKDVIKLIAQLASL